MHRVIGLGWTEMVSALWAAIHTWRGIGYCEEGHPLGNPSSNYE